MSEYPLPLANLKELFGDEYLVRASEEYEGRRKTPKGPFFQMIPCRRGVTIWPYGAELLGVSVKGRMIDRLLATGVIIESKSTICRDDPEAYKRTEAYRIFGEKYKAYLDTKKDYLLKPTFDELECNLVFHVDDLETVAQMVGARKRRKLSPEQKAQCMAALAQANAKSRCQSPILAISAR